jgi:hypothetical protein
MRTLARLAGIIIYTAGALLWAGLAAVILGRILGCWA